MNSISNHPSPSDIENLVSCRDFFINSKIRQYVPIISIKTLIPEDKVFANTSLYMKKNKSEEISCEENIKSLYRFIVRPFALYEKRTGIEACLSIKECQYLAYLLSHFTWEECYEKNDDVEENCLYDMIEDVYKDSKMKKNIELLKDNDHESVIDTLYYLFHYIPTIEHQERIEWVIKQTGSSYDTFKNTDLWSRTKKLAYLDPEESIRTSYGSEYLYFIADITKDVVKSTKPYYDRHHVTPLKSFQGWFMKVGNVCVICLKEKNLMACSRCQEAQYCSKEHQKQDWPRHKNECVDISIFTDKELKENVTLYDIHEKGRNNNNNGMCIHIH